MSQFIALALAIAKAVPVVDKWLSVLVAAYTTARIEAMAKEDREAIRKAFAEHDQRALEKSIGHPDPGAPSGVPGSVIRDRRPGVT